MERRSPTGIARQRETRPNNPAPDRAGARNPHHQRHAPPISRLRTHASPTAQNHGVERRSPTGIARERETRPNNPAPHQSHAYKPTHRQPRRITGWSAGLRPASRGSAKPALTTPPPANLTPTNPRIANRAESRGHGAPVSDRHRAGARNPHQRPRPPPISRLQTHASPTAQNHGVERRSPTGIARERETRTNNPAPHQSHAYKPTHRQPRRITGTWSAGLRPASRGSAKPAPTTPPPTNLTPANPRIANRAESRGGAPVSDRHRAAARNPHQRPRPPTSGQSSRWGPARAGLRPAPGPSVSGGFPH